MYFLYSGTLYSSFIILFYKQEENKMKIKTIAATQKGDQRILACALDAKEYTFAEDYCNFYLDMINADRRSLEQVSKFHIKKLISEMDSILNRKEKEKLERFYGLKGGIKHYLKVVKPNDKAYQRMLADAVTAAEKLCSFESLYKWQVETKETVDKIATKVYDPEKKYSNLEKAKLAHIYYRYISGMVLMPYDYKKNGNIVLPVEEKQTEESVFAVPDLLLQEWECFFNLLPDGDIIPEMVKKFLEVIPENCKDFIKKDCQLSENKYQRTGLGKVRSIKEEIFNTGNWFTCSFCTFSEIKKVRLKHFTDLIDVANAADDQWVGTHSRKRTVIFPAQGIKEVRIQEFFGKRTFASQAECKMFKSAIFYLEKTDFRYCHRLFKNYEFSKKLK